MYLNTCTFDLISFCLYISTCFVCLTDVLSNVCLFCLVCLGLLFSLFKLVLYVFFNVFKLWIDGKKNYSKTATETSNMGKLNKDN